MRKVLLLLGIICIFALSGCGKSDGISGTWVPKQQEGTGISSIVLEKENDLTYKGVVNYTDGKQISSMYKYDKTYNSLEEDPSDVIKKKKEYNIYGRIVLNFDDKHTIAHMGQSVQPEDTFLKNKKNKSYEVGGNLLHRAALVNTLLIRFYLFYEG